MSLIQYMPSMFAFERSQRIEKQHKLLSKDCTILAFCFFWDTCV